MERKKERSHPFWLLCSFLGCHDLFTATRARPGPDMWPREFHGFSVGTKAVPLNVRDRIMPPKDFHILKPRTCGCVTLPGKRDLKGVINLRILR